MRTSQGGTFASDWKGFCRTSEEQNCSLPSGVGCFATSRAIAKLSFGSAAFRTDAAMVGTYTAISRPPRIRTSWPGRLDLKSYAMAVLGGSFRGTTKRVMPRDRFGPARHTHVALDDAVEQGHLWLVMRRAAR